VVLSGKEKKYLPGERQEPPCKRGENKKCGKGKKNCLQEKEGGHSLPTENLSRTTKMVTYWGEERADRSRREKGKFKRKREGFSDYSRFSEGGKKPGWRGRGKAPRCPE